MTTSSKLQQCTSIQPFWSAKKVNSAMPFFRNDYPTSVIYELKSEDTSCDALNCVPGIGLIGILFSLDPNAPKAICCGLLEQSKAVPLFGMKHILCVHFFPGEFSRIFGVSSKDLSNKEIPLSDIIKLDNIDEKIANACTFAETIPLLKDFIEHWESRKRFSIANSTTRDIMRAALLNNGELKLEHLKTHTGYSERYLRQIIQEQVGLSPKTALENIRFQYGLHVLTANPNLPLANIAQHLGYYDQAHFTKTFKEYMNITPSKYINTLFYPE